MYEQTDRHLQWQLIFDIVLWLAVLTRLPRRPKHGVSIALLWQILWPGG